MFCCGGRKSASLLYLFYSIPFYILYTILYIYIYIYIYILGISIYCTEIPRSSSISGIVRYGMVWYVLVPSGMEPTKSRHKHLDRSSSSFVFHSLLFSLLLFHSFLIHYNRIVSLSHQVWRHAGGHHDPWSRTRWYYNYSESCTIPV